MSTATDVLSVTFAGGSLAVASWAAYTAHQARQWQRERDNERRETRARVTVTHSAESSPVFVMVVPDPDPRPFPKQYRLTIEVVNLGEAPEFVAGLRVEAHSNRGARHAYGIDLEQRRREDRELRPRERLVESVALESLDFDLSTGFVAAVEFASGSRILSERQDVRPELVAEIELFNRTARP